MGIPASKMIYNGTAHKTVGKLVEALLADMKDPDAVYNYLGGKTASLASAVSVAKKNLGLNTPKAKKAKKEAASAPVAKIADTVDSSEKKFCPHCGKPVSFRVVGVRMSAEGDVASRAYIIDCPACKTHASIHMGD